MLPPWLPGGTECGCRSPATATPIVPRNGASGNSTSRSTSAVAPRVSRSGNAPNSRPARSWTGVNTLTLDSPRGNSPTSAPLP